MKTLSLALIFALAQFAFAQSVDIKGTDTDSMPEGTTTTIEIKKGKTGTVPTATEKTWEITDGEADVEGEAAATNKDAKAQWKKACSDWKKELKDDHKDPKESKVLSLNCGKMECGGEAGQKICTSKATYKIKTKVVN